MELVLSPRSSSILGAGKTSGTRAEKENDEAGATFSDHPFKLFAHDGATVEGQRQGHVQAVPCSAQSLK